MSIDLTEVISVSQVVSVEEINLKFGVTSEESLIHNAEQAISFMITAAASKECKHAIVTLSQTKISKLSSISKKQSFQDTVASSKWTEHTMVPMEALKSLLRINRTKITSCCLTMIIRTPLFQSMIA